MHCAIIILWERESSSSTDRREFSKIYLGSTGINIIISIKILLNDVTVLKCCKNQKRGASPYGKCLPARLSRGARILGTLSFASRLLCYNVLFFFAILYLYLCISEILGTLSFAFSCFLMLMLMLIAEGGSRYLLF